MNINTLHGLNHSLSTSISRRRLSLLWPSHLHVVPQREPNAPLASVRRPLRGKRAPDELGEWASDEDLNDVNEKIEDDGLEE